MNNSNEIIRLIKDLRIKKNITIEELAKRTHIAKSTLSRYESGQREFPVNDLGKYADVLNTTVEFLLGIGGEKPIYKSIPLVGAICAGDGLLADQNIEEYIFYPFQNKRQPDYALRVKGNSMIGAGIEDGDIVYMRNATCAEYSGQIVAALINEGEDGVLKRIKWVEHSPIVSLVPENDKHVIIEVLSDQVRICGLYMGHFKIERN